MVGAWGSQRATVPLRNLRSLALGLACSSPSTASALAEDDNDDLSMQVAAVVTALVAGHGSGKKAADARPGRSSKQNAVSQTAEKNGAKWIPKSPQQFEKIY